MANRNNVVKDLLGLLDDAIYIGTDTIQCLNKAQLRTVNFSSYHTVFWNLSRYLSELGFAEEGVKYSRREFDRIGAAIAPIKEKLEAFLKSNGVLVLFAAIPKMVYVDHPTQDWRNSPYIQHLLDISGVTLNKGDKFVYSGPKELEEVFRDVILGMSYTYTLENKQLSSLFQDQRSRQVVGGYIYPAVGGVILIVPNPHSFGGHSKVREYVSALIDMGKHLIEHKKSGVTEEPEWSMRFFSREEKTIRQTLAVAEAELAKLQKEVQQYKDQTKELRSLNALYYESGDALLDVTEKALIELGFSIKRGPKNEADLLGHLDLMQPIAIEVKGENKGASKDNISQAEGWARDVNLAIAGEEHKRKELYDEYQDILKRLGFDLGKLRKDEIKTKSILILNTYRKSPIHERTDPNFPDSIQHEIKHREVCCLTTLQLLGLVKTCREHPEKKHALVKELADTEGEYPHFTQWTDFLEFE